MDFVEAQAELVEALAGDAVRHARFLQRIGPTVDQRAGRFPARMITDGGLQHGRPRAAAHAAAAHAVGTGIFQAQRGEVGHAIGRHILARVAYLVE